MSVSFYDLLADALDGEEFESQFDLDYAVTEILSDWEMEIGKVERWAKQDDLQVHRDLGVEVATDNEEN